MLNAFTRSTPGALIEEKTYSIAWHYCQCDPALGKQRAREVLAALQQKAHDLGLHLLQGDKVIEIKNPIVDKGKAARIWMGHDKYDYIMAIGDDTTDEDMFRALPFGTISIKVGSDQTAASYFVNSYKEVRAFLDAIDASCHLFNEGINLQLAS